jgi:hypothetical protein
VGSFSDSWSGGFRITLLAVVAWLVYIAIRAQTGC